MKMMIITNNGVDLKMMNITNEQIIKLKSAYNSNKEELKEVAAYIAEHGITDDGLTDSAESFEQGYNNAFEYVFKVLGIEPLKVEPLKKKDIYEFECNMCEEYANHDCIDEWGSAYVFLGDIGVEYNFCIDGGNCCAIYKTEINKETDYMETDYDTFTHYEIDFDNKNWKEELENAMCEALIDFHNL